jgi:LPXTG-site transpeptidase (sortase) family protein
MRLPKTLLKRSFILVSLAGLAFLSALISQLILAGPVRGKLAASIANASAIQQTTNKQSNVAIGLPTRLMIPRINLDASIEHVGLTTSGEMNTPKDPDNTAWYKSGPRPGDNGSSVIDGHFGLVNGKPAVFDNIYKLREGDKLYVQDEKGVMIAFVVRKLQTYSHNDDAKDVFISSDGKAHLNLITCSGTWDKASRNYSNRIVVFTEKD